MSKQIFIVNSKDMEYKVSNLADGSLYEGQCNNSWRHGYGTIKWSDNSLLKGEWKEDKQHGAEKYKNKYWKSMIKYSNFISMFLKPVDIMLSLNLEICYVK